MIDSMFDLSGRTALVTGASSGIGAHFAQVLASYGANVIVAARRMEPLSQLVQTIQASGGSAAAVAVDVTDSSNVKDMFDFAEEQFGVVDIVSNNAGVADAKLATGISVESWDVVINTNLKGAWLVAREAGTRMIEHTIPGSIVNTASILGLRVAISQASYATSKAGVIQLTKSLALEWSRYNIRVNALCPGYFITDINREYLTSEKGKAYIGRTPSRRTGELVELTAPFLLLASEAGSFINGVALPVDGAHSIGNM